MKISTSTFFTHDGHMYFIPTIVFTPAIKNYFPIIGTGGEIYTGVFIDPPLVSFRFLNVIIMVAIGERAAWRK